MDRRRAFQFLPACVADDDDDGDDDDDDGDGGCLFAVFRQSCSRLVHVWALLTSS